MWQKFTRKNSTLNGNYDVAAQAGLDLHSHHMFWVVQAAASFMLGDLQPVRADDDQHDRALGQDAFDVALEVGADGDVVHVLKDGLIAEVLDSA